jgi:inner membrane protein
VFLFAHAGITLGAATLITAAVERKPRALARPAAEPGAPSFSRWFESLARFLDIRILLVGALLPDIIDKPLGLFLIGSGRSYAHTLAFTLILALAGAVLYLNRRRTWLLALAFGSICHLVLDSMWTNPRTLLWPFYVQTLPAGPSTTVVWTLPSAPKTNWLVLWGSQFATHPGIDVGEAVGLIILILFLWTLVRRRSFIAFLTKGRIQLNLASN